MFNQKGLKRFFGKNYFLLLISILIIVGFLVFVFAATFPTNPADGTIRGGNYSKNIFLNCSTSIINSTGTARASNVTFFYNASGGPAPKNYSGEIANVGNLTGVVWNETAGNYSDFNITNVNISALPDGKYNNISCYADNGTVQEWGSIYNVTIDNTPPAVSFSGITNTINNGNYTNASRIINGSVTDATIGMTGGFVYVNISNSSGGWAPTNNWTLASNVTGGYYNATIDFTTYPDGKYNITIIANDSLLLRNASNVPEANINNTERIQITIDQIAPTTPTIANTTSTTTTQVVATITATDATSGVDNCVSDSSSGVTITGRGTGTQTLTHEGLSCGTVYNYIITCYDQVGNSNVSAQTSLSTSPCTVSESAGGGAGVGVETKTHSWTKITPGVAIIMKDFDPEVGVKEISIEVSNEAQNVKITVTKYDDTPAEVSVAKTGKVYRYLKIDTQNLVGKLSKATMTIQIEKSWVSDNALDKENIALFKFDETSQEWNELPTTHTEEDDDYYYYEAEVTSFSYFVIGEKAVGEEVIPEEEEVISLTKKNLILWIVVALVVLAAIIGVILAKRKKK